MTLRILRLVARRSSSRRALSPVLLGALALVALALFPASVAAQTGCPTGPITGNLVLSGNIVASATGPNPCITVGSDNLMVNLSGFTIDVTALGNAGVAIDTGNTSGVMIGGGGKIITAYTSTSGTVAAIKTASSTNITVTGLDIWNVTASCTPGDTTSTNQRNQNAGNAILMSNVTGGSISTNDIECYQTGITISASDIPHNGTGVISGNNFVNNTYDNSGASTTTASAGLVLDSSSGWTVQMNYASYNGSLNSSYACAVLDPGCFAAIRLTGTSNGNSVLLNNLYDNFGPGIYTGPNTYRNKIQQNTNTANALYDLWDDVPPHSSNNWNKNTCPDGELGSVSPQRCP